MNQSYYPKTPHSLFVFTSPQTYPSSRQINKTKRALSVQLICRSVAVSSSSIYSTVCAWTGIFVGVIGEWMRREMLVWPCYFRCAAVCQVGRASAVSPSSSPPRAQLTARSDWQLHWHWHRHNWHRYVETAVVLTRLAPETETGMASTSE